LRDTKWLKDSTTWAQTTSVMYVVVTLLMMKVAFKDTLEYYL
jgi:hypothetical protein